MSFERYIPSNSEQADFYKYFETQALQYGAGLETFAGQRYQRGAGLGTVLRALSRTVAPLARSALKAAGKSVVNKGLEIAGDNLLAPVGEMVKAVKKKRKPRVKKARPQKGRGLGRRPVKRTLKPIKGRKKSIVKDLWTAAEQAAKRSYKRRK